jgi:hypothetical protein
MCGHPSHRDTLKSCPCLHLIYIRGITFGIKMGNVATSSAAQRPYKAVHRQHGQIPNMPYVHDNFWRTTGVHWEGESTSCIIDDPVTAFRPLRYNGGDNQASLDFEQHVFSKICGMIRTRAMQLNSQIYPEDRRFFTRYTIKLGSSSGWDAETAADIRHIIERLRFRCGGPLPIQDSLA